MMIEFRPTVAACLTGKKVTPIGNLLGACNPSAAGRKAKPYGERTLGLSTRWLAMLIGLFALSGWTGGLCAQSTSIPIPNGSFESPVTTNAGPQIDAWQKSPKPAWYDDSSGFPWDQLVGAFMNTPPTSSDHIDNCDGNQAAFLFALPQVAIFQDYDSTAGTNTTPSHAFNAKFEIGKSYTLTAGVIGGGGGMTNGATLQISLYYRDNTNMVTVAATTITNTPAIFPNNTHFIDFVAHALAVKTNDPWAGQHIGVQLLSTIDPAAAGGYWDVDNVRLSATSSAVSLSASLTNGQFQLILQSEPASRFEILAATNLTVPLTNWTSLATLTNVTGKIPFTDIGPNLAQRFYQARQLP
jgi:hypothetical protein